MQLWMRLAELAADEDAVRGSRARALSLAETLVLFARRAGAPSAAIVCTTLVFEEAGLALRVERLLRQVTNSAPPAQRSVTMAIGSAGLGIVLAMALLAALLATQLHNLPEHLLHLG